jgi:2-keto-4-pentenoate hydratase/2-oxohepta-3-ene-1,7-dioic acid hydratase in catechol pathway
MKFARFKTSTDGAARCAVLQDGRLLEIEGDIFGKWDTTGASYDESEVHLLSPLIPHSIIGVGKNYLAPNEARPDKLPEIPVFFFKPTSSVIGPNDEIKIPSSLDKIKFESELAVVIGKEARHISEQEAMDYVFGYTIANDVTAPQFFHQDGHWMVGKSFDTFTPMGPYLETELDLSELYVQARHNEQLKQDSPLEFMILTIPYLISYLSHVMTLKPGDVLLSGSPAGADFMSAEDFIECQIAGIGSLRNKIVSSISVSVSK